MSKLLGVFDFAEVELEVEVEVAFGFPPFFLLAVALVFGVSAVIHSAFDLDPDILE